MDSNDFEEIAIIDTELKSSKCGSKKNEKTSVSEEAETYLTNVSDFISQSYDPKLKREEKKLKDLLESYKQLCKDFSIKSKVEDKLNHLDKKVPEIYAILHPELYRDPRESEKEKLIAKLARRPFFQRGKLGGERGSTPITNLYDLRQKEKERFTRLVASAPSPLINLLPLEQKNRTKRFFLEKTLKESRFDDSREKEKERLARILSTSQQSKQIISKTSQKKVKELNKKINLSNKEGKKEIQRTHIGSSSQKTGRTNIQENQEVKKVMKSQERSVSPAKSCSEMDSPRTSSIGTQTDDLNDLDFHVSPQEFVQVSSQDHAVQTDIDDSSPITQTSNNHHLFISPKEKLILDLHGTSPIIAQNDEYNPSKEDDIKEQRSKQMAYAEALRKQIQEKQMLENEKKRREKEEEEMIERKFREQQERLEMEYNREQNQRLGWIQQRAEQENMVRQKLQEMELETEKMKHHEWRKKRSENSELPINYGIPGRFSQRVEEPKHRGPSPNPVLQFPTRFSEPFIQVPLLEGEPPSVLSPREFRGVSENVSRTGGNWISRQRPANTDSDEKEENEVKIAERKKRGDERSPSPVVPALRTEALLRRNSRFINDNWEVPDPQKLAIPDDFNNGNMRQADNILTHLGEFRRQLQLEHLKMQRRIESHQQSP